MYSDVARSFTNISWYHHYYESQLFLKRENAKCSNFLPRFWCQTLPVRIKEPEFSQPLHLERSRYPLLTLLSCSVWCVLHMELKSHIVFTLELKKTMGKELLNLPEFWSSEGKSNIHFHGIIIPLQDTHKISRNHSEYVGFCEARDGMSL